MRKIKKIVDKYGTRFESFKELGEFYKIDGYNVAKLVRMGVNIDEAIARSKKSLKLANNFNDGHGHTFTCLREVAKFYGLSVEKLKHRMSHGYDLRDAIELAKVDLSRVSSVDHLGNSFKSIRDMCKFHGVDTNFFYKRYLKGLPLETCLTKKEKVIKDHLGNEYKSFKELAQAYNIDYDTFIQRKNILKHDIKACLVPPTRQGNNVGGRWISDGMSHVFESYAQLCRYHNIDYKVFLYAKKLTKGDIKKAISVAKNKGNSKNRGGYNVRIINMQD